MTNCAGNGILRDMYRRDIKTSEQKKKRYNAMRRSLIPRCRSLAAAIISIGSGHTGGWQKETVGLLEAKIVVTSAYNCTLNQLSRRTKVRLFHSIVKSVLLHACEKMWGSPLVGDGTHR